MKLKLMGQSPNFTTVPLRNAQNINHHEKIKLRIQIEIIQILHNIPLKKYIN